MNNKIGSMVEMNGRGRNGGGRWLRRFATGAVLAASLSLAAQADPDGHKGGPAGHGPGGSMGIGMEFNPAMMRELQLSPDQEKKLKESRLAHQKKKIQLRSDKAILELDLKHILSTYPVNKAEALKLADKLAEVDKKILSLRIESMVQLLSGLSAEQHAKLMALQEEWHQKRKTWMEEMRKDKRGDRNDKGRKHHGPGKGGGPG